MRRNIYGKMISAVMAMALCVTSVNVSAVQLESEITKKNALMSDKQEIIENDDKSIDDEGREKPVVIKEIKSMRDENSNTYLMSNGMKKTVYYSDNIRFEEDGKLKKYNSELVAAESQDKKIISLAKNISVKNSKKYKYVNKSGDTKQYLPETIGEESPVLLTQDDYRISFVPLDAGENSDDYVETKTDKVSLETEKIEDAVTGKKEEKSIKAVYENTGNDTKIAYHSLEHGMKEDIILNEIPDNNEFLYKICTENLEVRLDAVGGGISFIDKEKDSIVAGIPAPSMNDSTGKAYSEDVHYELEKSVSETKGINAYILKIVVDNDYLTSTDREYPVTIDPSVTWEGTGELGEAYILKANPDVNYYASGVKAFSVGKGSQGLFRTYMRALDLKSTVRGKYVESAKLILYENGANTKGVKINVEPVKNEFACRNITWNNQPGGTGDSLATFTSSGTADAKKTLNMTTWARNVAKGSGSGNKNYGLVFKAEKESASSYVKFYGSRTASTSKMPKMEVVYYDGPTKPENVSLTKVHIKSGEKLQVSWSGITSKALDYVQYKVKNYDESTHSATTDYIAYSDSTKLGTTSSGTKTIDASSGWKEGHYYLYVRGVDKGGIKSPEKAIGFVIDRTAPVLNSVTITPSTSASSYSNKLPKITWNVTEKNLLSIQVKVNNGNYAALADSNTGNATIGDFESEKVNTIAVRATDRAGNVSSEKKFTYYYDDDAPEIDMKVIPDTDEDKYDNSPDMPQLEYSINDGTLKDYRLTVNGKSQTLLENKGTVTIENIEEGENSIAISATDKAGNDTEEECLYYRDITNPTKGTVKITPKTGFFNSSSDLPVIKWSDFEDDNLSEIQVKIDDGKYQTLGYEANGEARLQEKDFNNDGKYNIKVRAIDKAGNVSDDVSYNYYYEKTEQALEDYAPTDVYVVEQIGGNTVLRFSTKSGKFNDSIKYQVYRGTTPLFIPDDDTLIKTVSSKGAIKVSGNENTIYYYKIRAIKEKQTQNSAFSEEISSTTLSAKTISDRLGNNSLYEYESVSTPNGTGYVELSKGNFIYEQNDITLPAPQIPINISRVYNSKAQVVSSFGYGWSDAYDMYVSETDDKIYYSDDTKSIYTFVKEGDTYKCVENSELSLETDDDILYKTIEKKDTNGNVISNTNLELDVYYKITEKEGEVYRFDDCGRLILIEENNDTFVYIRYNEKNGKIAEVVTSSGQKAEYSYNKEGFISNITAAKGTDSEYGYQYSYENGYLVRATFVGTKGGKIDYNYSYKNGNVSVISDAEGNNYCVEYVGDSMDKFVYPNGDNMEFNRIEDKANKSVTTTVKKKQVETELYSESYVFDEQGKITVKTDASGNKSEYKYDDKNNKTLLTESTDRTSYYALEGDTVVKKTSGKSDKTVYDSHGNVTEQVDADGSITKYSYDYSKGRADSVINLPTEMIEKNANGIISSHEVYQYDNQGNTVKLIDKVTNTITNYRYNADGTVDTSNEIIVEDVESDNAEKYGLEAYSDDTQYNADGDELSESSSEGTVNEENIYTYDEVGNVITETDKTNNITTSYKYDEFLRVIKTTETAQVNGKKTTKNTENGYDKNGSKIKSVDEEGRITEYTYDSMNRVIETKLIVGSDEKVTRTAYSYGSVSINTGKGMMTVKNATVTTITNTSDEVVGKTYTDSLGRTVRELNNGLYVDYTYDNDGRIFTTYTGGMNETDANEIAEGKLSVNTYDAYGNQTDTIINPEVAGDTFKVGENSIVTSNEYDAAGMLIKSTDANGNSTCYEYDEQGRVTKVTTAVGTSNQYSYDNIEKDSKGNIKSVVDTVTDALGSVSKTTTNGTEQVLSIKDETSSGSIETTYEYDVNGQKIKEAYSDGSYLTFTYDVYGNNVKKSAFDANGNEINSTEYVYDGDGNIIEAVDNKNGTPYRYTFYEYDAYGRNISVAEINATSKPSDSAVENAKLKYVYNIDDNVAKIYYPNTTGDKLKGIAFKYNKDKWITEIDGLLSGDDAVAIRKYEYYSDGKISCIRDFQNFLDKNSDYVERDYNYDVFDRVISMKYYDSTNKDFILEQYDYEYDKNSNITYKHEKYNYSNNLKDEEVTYTYNKLNQLAESVKNNKLTYKTITSSYSYDSVGNRTYEKIIKKDTVATDKTFDEATYNYYSYNRLNQLSGKTEVITDGTTTKTYTGSYKYDARGNQIEVTDGKSKTITKYTYDVENQLTDVEVTTDGKKTGEQHNIYNGNGQRISKTDIVIDGDNKKSNTTCYFYEGSLLLYTTDDSGKKISQNVIGNQDNIIVGIRYSGGNQKEYFYAKDVQGSITNITDNTGACVQSYDYTDFGETAQRIATDFENEICYTGGIYDELTGLYYLNARYYNPDEGVFLSQDTYRGTEKNAECWNLYAYCANNPINYVDPSGHTASLIQSGQYLPAEAWESIKKIEKDSNSNNKNNKKKNKLTKVQKLFVAVIAGEAIGEGKKSWKAIAHIIMNRVRDKTHDFKNYNTVTKVIKQPYQFSSYFYKDRQYLKAKNYLKKRKPKNKRYERLIKAVIPIYKGKKKDITKGALLYYSPKSMNPRGSEPSWDFSKLKEIKIKGIASNNFRFYKYK